MPTGCREEVRRTTAATCARGAERMLQSPRQSTAAWKYILASVITCAADAQASIEGSCDVTQATYLARLVLLGERCSMPETPGVTLSTKLLLTHAGPAECC